MLIQRSLGDVTDWSAGASGPTEYPVGVGPARRAGNLLLGGGGLTERARRKEDLRVHGLG